MRTMARLAMITGCAIPVMLAMAPAASAQDVVVMRRAIAVAKPIAYIPVYSSQYGTCTGGNQSAPITACKRPNGNPASLSSCASQPQTVSQKCTSTPTCGTMRVGFWSTEFNKNGLLLSTNTTDVGTARSLCQQYATQNGKTGTCAVQTAVGYVNFYEGLKVLSSGRSDNYATMCE